MSGKSEYWDRRSQVYDDVMENAYRETNEETVERFCRYLKKTDNVLDFACGTGYFSAGISGRVSTIRAIDISAGMVEKARKNLERKGATNVILSQGELMDRDLKPGSFDAVIAANVVCYLEDWNVEMGRIRELLKPGGVLLTVTDCLGQGISMEGFRKYIRLKRGKMPYARFFRTKELVREIEKVGFEIRETAILHRFPSNLFVAAVKK